MVGVGTGKKPGKKHKHFNSQNLHSTHACFDNGKAHYTGTLLLKMKRVAVKTGVKVPPNYSPLLICAGSTTVGQDPDPQWWMSS